MNTEQMVQDFRNKGNACYNTKKILDAISYYKKGLELDATNPHLNSNLAQAYLEECDFVSAEHHAMIAVANNRDSAKGYFRAAKASVGLGDKAKAVKFLKEGIKVCSNSNTEDLRSYLKTLCEEDPSGARVTPQSSQEDIAQIDDVPPLTSDSDSDECVQIDKLRSRSTSRMSAATTSLDTNKTSIINQRSISMSRTSSDNVNIKENKKLEKKRGNVEVNPFIATLESIKKELGIKQITPEQFWIMQRNELQSHLKEGSEVMASGLSRKAVEKYKTALDMILDHCVEDFRIKEIDVIVLKYALCVGWIDLANYGDIVKGLEYLKDIEENHASKFPAVFYGLGSAYYKLNRYKAAVEHVEKGLLFLKREVKFEVHPWPGTNSVIQETTRNGLQEVLKELLKTCRAYHEPDAICRYSQCLTLSSHIIPSEHIFYSDPDFCGFVIVICQEKCRIEYHLACWKEYKEAVMSNEIGKLSDKDFIGRFCPTTDCVTQASERSVITKIEIVGDDTTVKASIEAPKTEAVIKDSKKTKKRKGAEIAIQDKPKSKPRQKIKKIISETIQVASQETQATNSAEELAVRLEKLQLLRDVNFGYTDDNHWDPKENYYGREDVQRLDHFLSPEFTEETESVRGKKEFVFSYFYEFIRKEGPQKIKEVERKWQNEVGDFEGVNDVMTSHTSICSFLLQSYHFGSIDDYICIAEQMAVTYIMAETELVESLSFTLRGLANYTKSLTDTSQLNSDSEVMINQPSRNSPKMDSELNWILTSNLNIHNFDSKSTVETMLWPFVDKPSASTNNGEAFIPHAEVVDVIEDPDISTAEGNVLRANKTHLTSMSESVGSEGERVDSFLSDNSCDDSDKIDNRSNEVADDGGEQQEEKIIRNEEEEDGMVKEEEENKDVEDLDKSLNPDANEFKLPAVVPEQEELTFHPEGDVEPTVTDTAVSVPDERIQLLHTTSGCDVSGTFSSLHPAYSKSEKWSLEDGQPKGQAVNLISAYSQRTSVPTFVQRPLPYGQTFCTSVFPSQQLPKPSDNSTQADDVRNFEEKIRSLESTVKKLEKELKETAKQALESKLEQQDKKVKKLELELAKIQEEKNKDIKVLKEKLTKKEEEFEAEKTRFDEERKEKQILVNNTSEMMRNLISETGQKVKELEEELVLTKTDLVQYQNLAVEAKKEAGRLQINVLNKKCLDTLQAMRWKVKYLTNSSIPNKTEVTTAIKNWEQYLVDVTEHEVQFRIHCTTLNQKLGNITLADIVKLEWPNPPDEPSCPLDTLEEMTRKALDEREDMKGKLIVQDKAMAQLKLQQQKAVDDLALVEEQTLKLRKVIKNRNEMIENTLINKEMALPPSETLPKLNEVDKKVDSSNLKREEKLEQKPEKLVGSGEMDFEQKGHSYVSFSTLSVNPATGVPLLQHSTPVYGCQPLLCSSPYFYNHPQTSYPLTMPMQYGQQQGQPVTSSGSAFWSHVPQVSIGSDKASVQQQPETKLLPSLSLTEVPNILASAAVTADKSQSPSENIAVPVKKKLPSSASGLTPIEINKSMPIESTFATATSQEKAVPDVAKGFPISPSTVEVPKQKLPQMSKPAETLKPFIQTSLTISAASTLEPRTNITSAPKPKAKSSFQKLMDQLCKNFPNKTEDELSSCVVTVRERNNNSLTGLALPLIINMVDKVLKEKENKKQGSMGLDKFGGTAWGGVHNSASYWSKPNESLEEDCSICMESMNKDQTTLHCKHSFHTKCIRQWLHTESVCPICRLFTRMVDEFPPLS